MSIADFLLQRKQEKATANLKEALEFLEENKQKPSVQETSSGLQYEVLSQSDQDNRPEPTQSVTVHYEGRLLNGKVFDSSIKRDRPATFPLNAVIAGWTEGLQLMSVGSNFRFFIPPDLGYGSRQVGSDIPPNSLLIFDVTLLEIR